MKKAGSRAGFYCVPLDYFLSAGFDSLGEAGIGAVFVAELELLELLDPIVFVVLVVFVVSAGAGAGVGVGAGAATGGVGAGGGVTTFSSFLQAIRPTARMAARRSERFIIFPLWGVTQLTTKI